MQRTYWKTYFLFVLLAACDEDLSISFIESNPPTLGEQKNLRFAWSFGTQCVKDNCGLNLALLAEGHASVVAEVANKKVSPTFDFVARSTDAAFTVVETKSECMTSDRSKCFLQVRIKG